MVSVGLQRAAREAQAQAAAAHLGDVSQQGGLLQVHQLGVVRNTGLQTVSSAAQLVFDAACATALGLQDSSVDIRF